MLQERIDQGTDKPCITGNVLKDPEAKLNRGKSADVMKAKGLLNTSHSCSDRAGKKMKLCSIQTKVDFESKH